MNGRDEPIPAGDDRGHARTRRRRRRRRSWRNRKESPGATANAVKTEPETAQPETGTTAPSQASTKPSGGQGRARGGKGRTPPARLRRVEEVSAGGLVVDDRDGTVVGALIAKHDRRGRLVWSLPKGHVESGETFEQTAVREVAEETGVTGEVVGPVGTVDYWFVFEGRKIHKTVHHFLLRRLAGELSDHDVEVVEVAWFPLAEIPSRLAYPDERRLIGQVHELLAKSA